MALRSCARDILGSKGSLTLPFSGAETGSGGGWGIAGPGGTLREVWFHKHNTLQKQAPLWVDRISLEFFN